MASETGGDVVGFDLGHGETALARARVDAAAAPSVLDLVGRSRRQHVTAVAETDDGQILIGDEAMRTPEVRRLWFGFKARTLTDPETRRPMRMFVERIVQDLVGTGTIADPSGIHWIFGVPSGWTNEHRREYQALLTEAGLTNAIVVAESRAALLYARDSGEVRVDNGRITQSVLMIDIGSSTTDYTHVEELSEEAMDHGNVDLGANLIDKQILRVAIDRHANRDRIDELLAIDPSTARRLELDCREIKEKFFRTRREALLARGARVGHIEPVETPTGDDLLLDLRISAADMDAVLDANQPALGHKSWRQAFHDDVEHAIQWLPRLPDLVLLTGGPSRMPFIFDTCVELVGGDRVVLGSEPEFAIARGLALAGRTSLRSKGFRKDLGKIAPKIRPLVEGKIPELANVIGKVVAANMTERHVIPAFLAWRNNQIRTLHDMVNTVVQGVNTDMDPEHNLILTEVTTEWQNKLRAELDNITRPVCNRWHLEPSAMTLPPITVTPAGHVTTIELDGMTRNINTAANAVNTVVAAVVAMTLFGAGTAIIATTGPIGVIFAFLVGLGILAAGKEEFMDKIKTINIWPFARKLSGETKVINDLRTKAAANEAELAQKLAEELTPTFADKLTTQIATDITTELNAAADRAELLIR